MPTLIRFLRLLSVVTWVGGLIFFAFVLAPVAFSVLPSTHVAGIVVGGTLRVLHIVGLVCGAIFWIATAGLIRRHGALRGGYGSQIVLASGMLLATTYLQFEVLPAMERDRTAAGGDIEASPKSSPARLDFDRLHKHSEQVEGGVLFLGLGIVLLMARESTPAKAVNS